MRTLNKIAAALGALLLASVVIASTNIGDGYVELVGNHRNSAGVLLQTPLDIGITQGRLQVTRAGGDSRLLTSTSAIQVNAGVIGTAGGAAGDTALLTVIIFKNATAATLTVAGFQDESGTARNLVFSGSSTQDTVYELHGIVNGKGAMTLTASIADVVLVAVQPN